MEPLHQEVAIDLSRAKSMDASLEVDDGNVFDSAIGIVVGLGLGLLSWGVIVVLWMTLL